jgi:hypothetical protein
MAGNFYNRKASSQMKSITSNMMAGLNALKKSDMIKDDQLSDGWDAKVDPETNAIILESLTTNVILASNATGSGQVIAAVSAKDTSSYDYVALVTKDIADTDNAYIDDLVLLCVNSNVKTTVDISSYSLTGTVSMCLFNTEAARYVVFAASGNKYLFYHDFTTLRTATLPFYPKKMCCHYNRVFCIDTYNKLWWCRAGDLSTWYGTDSDDDYIVAATTMKNGSYTVLASPDVPRPVTVTVTKASTIDTLGLITVSGTDSLGEALTETITPVDGITTGFKAFKTISTVVGSGWSAVAGSDSIKVGIAPVNGFSQTDAGVWTLEQEYTLVDMTVLSSSLYIWSPFNIYVFQGYSYDTFSLTKVISNLGCLEAHNVTACGNRAYFWGTSTELYEYNGESYPAIINKPVFVNGSVSNGIYGSYEPWTDIGDLCAISGNLYMYPSIYEDGVTDATPDVYYHQMRVYDFDINSRTWWKLSGFSSAYLPAYEYNALYALYIQNVEKSDTYNIMTVKTSTGNATWTIYTYMGHAYNRDSYVVTKAYNNGITDDMTLTNIILYVRYNKEDPVG